VVLVGGTGVVGRELARLLDEQCPALPVAVTGRRLDGARAALASSRQLALAVDLSAEKPLELVARAIVTAVNDPAERVLTACVDAGIPHVDIARYTPRLLASWEGLRTMAVVAPVLFASGWMGGTVPVLARALSSLVGKVHSVDTAILYDLQDRAGPDSVEFMDRMDASFEAVERGRTRVVRPLTCAGHAEFGGRRRGMLRFDTPEQHTLPRTLGAKTAVTRIGFTSEAATCALHLLGQAGFFRAFRGARWTRMRRALLHSTGRGGTAQVRVSVEGERGTARADVVDPRGQAHLTAVGARVALGLALGLDGERAAAGPFLPEQLSHPDAALEIMRRSGVSLEIHDDSRMAA
jgi:saccharopine dehydrogenase-like NADP-dependent oxidoreductase